MSTDVVKNQVESAAVVVEPIMKKITWQTFKQHLPEEYSAIIASLKLGCGTDQWKKPASVVKGFSEKFMIDFQNAFTDLSTWMIEPTGKRKVAAGDFCLGGIVEQIVKSYNSCLDMENSLSEFYLAEEGENIKAKDYSEFLAKM